ncbi:hypothetical protein ACYOEI_04190 [Singulisphaera rosea]
MHTYPLDERRIAEVEQGRSCEAVVPLPSKGTLMVGDAVLFALSVTRRGQSPYYFMGGDSVAVSLTGVTDLGVTDPATGRALVQLSWASPGRREPSENMHGRAGKSRRSRGSL